MSREHDIDLNTLIDAVAHKVLSHLDAEKLNEAAKLLLHNKYYVARMFDNVASVYNNLSLPLLEDNTRFLQLGLLATEIEVKKLSGCVAELGVYQGNFSKYIGKAFPKRPYYLFDTFEGFNPAEAKHDEATYNAKCGDFSDTSVELALRGIPNRNRCIVKKGFFPETATEVDDQFVFVSIDTDLYQPTLAGLEFFYPRLVRGGYILVHDYGSFNYPGCRDAVRTFCFKHSAPYIPIPDAIVSALIVKN